MRVHVTRSHMEGLWQSFHDVDDLPAFLSAHFNGTWPPTTRIYRGQCCVANDVTPTPWNIDTDIERLREIGDDEDVHVVVYPGEPITVVTVFALAALTMIRVLTRKPTPKPNRIPPGSPNNLLGNRVNTARLNGRIADMFGLQKSYPDLIQVPYRTFVRTTEFENLYMCVGRGEYDIDADTVRDGDTEFSLLPGAAATFYAPGSSPNLGTAQLVIGASPVNQPLVNIYRVNEVSSIQLPSPSSYSIPTRTEYGSKTSVAYLRAVQPDILELGTGPGGNGSPDSSNRSWGDMAAVGRKLMLIFSPSTIQLGTIAFDYEIVDVVSDSVIRLLNPNLVASDWDLIDNVFGGAPGSAQTPFESNARAALPDRFEVFVDNTIGPFKIDMPELTEVWLNFFAPRGLWASDQLNNTALVIQLEITLQPIDAAGAPSGAPEVFIEHCQGSALSSSSLGFTFKLLPTIAGRQTVSVRYKKTLVFNPRFPGPTYFGALDLEIYGAGQDVFHGGLNALQTELNWVDCYGVEIVTQPHFGDVTTVHVQIPSSTSARGVKERRFNAEVTRKVACWDGTNFVLPKAASRLVENIFAEVARDPFIGRLSGASYVINSGPVDLNRAAIVAAFQLVRSSTAGSAVGAVETGNFDITLDSENIAAEDTLQMIAQSAFCDVYREGAVVQVKPELRNYNAVMVLNHRNITRGSQTRQTQFFTDAQHGNALDTNDGIELDYMDELYKNQTFRYPFNKDAVSPKKIEVAGLSSYTQAFFHGMREMQRIRFQNTSVELEATHDVSILTLNDRVLIADTTRPPQAGQERSGEVLGMSGLTLSLSQSSSMAGVQTIYLQHTDGSVEQIPGSPGATPNTFVLSFAPSLPLVTDSNDGRRTRYIQAVDIDRRARAFLVTEKAHAEKFKYKVRGNNYTDLFYLYDNCLFWYVAFPATPKHLDQGPYSDTYTNVVPPILAGAPDVLGTPTTTFDADRRDFVYQGHIASGAGLQFQLGHAGQGSFTFACWVKYDPNIGHDQTIARVWISGGTNKWELKLDDPSGDVQWQVAGVTYANAPWPDDQWHLVSGTYLDSSSLVFLYIDGVIVDTGSSVPQFTIGLIFIANAIVGSNSGEGRLHDARFWRKSFTADEHFDLYRVEKIVL